MFECVKQRLIRIFLATKFSNLRIQFSDLRTVFQGDITIHGLWTGATYELGFVEAYLKFLYVIVSCVNNQFAYVKEKNIFIARKELITQQNIHVSCFLCTLLVYQIHSVTLLLCAIFCPFVIMPLQALDTISLYICIHTCTIIMNSWYVAMYAI